MNSGVVLAINVTVYDLIQECLAVPLLFHRCLRSVCDVSVYLPLFSPTAQARRSTASYVEGSRYPSSRTS